MNENEKKLEFYNALDKIYNNNFDNDSYEVFNFWHIKTIFLNDIYINIEDKSHIQLCLEKQGICIKIAEENTLQVRYDELTNFSFWIEA